MISLIHSTGEGTTKRRAGQQVQVQVIGVQLAERVLQANLNMLWTMELCLCTVSQVLEEFSSNSTLRCSKAVVIKQTRGHGGTSASPSQIITGVKGVIARIPWT